MVADYRRFDGTLWLQLFTQAPHIVRSVLAGVLDIPENKIRIVTGDVGGAFGAKLNIYPEDVLAAVLSRKHGHPVKWIEQRSESMVATSHGRALIAEVEVAATSDGLITGLHVSVLSDIGASFGPIPPFGGLLTCQMISGCYRIPQITFDFKVAFTNKTPVEPYRGYYRAEASYFIERAVDLVAAELSIDPVEIRRRNFIGAEQFPFRTATGELYDSGDYAAALDTALELVGYAQLRDRQRHLREEGRYIGIGIASYAWRASFPSKGMAMSPDVDFLPAGWEAASVRVERSGGVTIRTGACPHGQGFGNALATIVEDQLGVPRSDITVIFGDTDTSPYGMGSEGSRALVTAGSAVYFAAERVRHKATALAAHHLEATVEDLEWDGTTVAVRGVPSKGFTLYDLARIASQGAHRPEGMEPGLEAWASFDPEDFNYPSGVQISVVDVDPDTGHVTILEQVAVDDCGKRISPMIVEGQVHGGTAQGIGQALYEEATYDSNGQPLNTSFLTYGIPSAPDLPFFETAGLETFTDRNPLGAKGAGEAGAIGAPPSGGQRRDRRPRPLRHPPPRHAPDTRADLAGNVQAPDQGASMKICLYLPVVEDPDDGEPFGKTYELASLVEDAGFDALFVGHHHVTPGYVTAPWVLLAAIAARTTRLRLGTSIFLLPMHHPIDVAEQVATLDHISNGRVILGAGIGYRPNEYEAFQPRSASGPREWMRPSRSSDVLDGGGRLLPRPAFPVLRGDRPPQAAPATTPSDLGRRRGPCRPGSSRPTGRRVDLRRDGAAAP